MEKKQKLIKVSPLDSANVAGLMYVIMGVLYAGGFAIIAQFDPEFADASTGLIVGTSLAMLIGMPLVGWVMVFITTAIGNLFLKVVGGIEVTFKS